MKTKLYESLKPENIHSGNRAPASDIWGDPLRFHFYCTYFKMPWEFMFHRDITELPARISTCDYNSQHTSRPRTKWEPVIPDKHLVLPAILRFHKDLSTNHSFICVFLLFWLSNGIMATSLGPQNALTLLVGGLYSTTFHHWEEMRWCYDECGRCLFFSDEHKGDGGFSVSQMFPRAWCCLKNWAHS